MKSTGSVTKRASALAIVLLVGGTLAMAQDSQEKPTLNKDKQQQQQSNAATGLTMDAAPAAPVSSEEDTAFKAFQTVPTSDLQKKISAGEDFLQKFPQSRYRTAVYSLLTVGYIQLGQSEKAFAIGDKELELNPNDVQTMAILSQTIPRAFNAAAPDAAKKLDKAEQYGKRAVEVVPTLVKPEGITDENFVYAKNQTLAMAHSGLGVVDWRRGKFADAIPELEQAVKLDPNPDPVNLYILGVSNQNTAHYEDAAIAYGKCAAVSPAGKLQDDCKNRAEEAKKLAATKLSAPK